MLTAAGVDVTVMTRISESEPPSLSVTVIVTVVSPALAYVWLPRTVRRALFTIAVEVAPSTQSILAAWES
jgi:hypothetical protein